MVNVGTGGLVFSFLQHHVIPGIPHWWVGKLNFFQIWWVGSRFLEETNGKLVIPGLAWWFGIRIGVALKNHNPFHVPPQTTNYHGNPKPSSLGVITHILGCKTGHFSLVLGWKRVTIT